MKEIASVTQNRCSHNPSAAPDRGKRRPLPVNRALSLEASLLRCIYCLEEKPEYCYKKKEHVIPRAFGKFEDNLVLKGAVCDHCNQFFGNAIELYLGRDTFESIERLRYGIKPKEALRSRRRIKSKIRNGALKGAIVRERGLGKSGRIDVERVVQVGFYHTQRDEYDYFEPKDILSAKVLTERGYAVKNAQILMIANEGEELDALIDNLTKLGFSLNPKTSLIEEEPPQAIVPIETDLTIDKTIMRGFCKIAFNYLAYVAGTDFVLSPEFNPIRTFIRKGEGQSDRFLGVNLPPILHDDQRLDKFGTKVTQGHLIIVGWRGRNVVSKVSLFNTNTFGILLCKDFKGIWRPIKLGHHFDVEERKVTRLISLSKALMP
jgi:hypothetical protein